MSDTPVEIHIMTWQDLTIEVRYKPNYFGEGDDAIAHLDITCIQPNRHPLPFSETGYRSHFLRRSWIEGIGGPVDFVTAWLLEASSKRGWQELKTKHRQLSLF